MKEVYDTGKHRFLSALQMVCALGVHDNPVGDVHPHNRRILGERPNDNLSSGLELIDADPVADGLASTLREVRNPVVDVECKRCSRAASIDRQAILKRCGALITFARLRRLIAMGCDQLCSPDGDKCRTRFPYLDNE